MMLLRELVRVLVLPAAAFFSFLGDRSRLGDMPCCRRSVAGKAPVHLFLSGLTDGPSFPPTPPTIFLILLLNCLFPFFYSISQHLDTFSSLSFF